MSDENLVLHVDSRPAMRLRSRIFGHDDAIVPFKEGIIAKKCLIAREVKFYLEHMGWLHSFLPADMIPQVKGLGKTIRKRRSSEVQLQVSPITNDCLTSQCPYIIMNDLSNGFARPAVLDIKLGCRTWALGTDPIKAERMKRKCQSGKTSHLGFRVRAAMWFSKNKSDWPLDDDISYITREFGNNCTEEQLNAFMSDFFHYRDQIPYFLQRLESLREVLVNLRSKCNIRLFSSSVVLTYDEDDPTKMECRLLDFAKCYLDITRAAEAHQEDVCDCEDGVVSAVENLIVILRSIQ